jgi:hypothetical protein
MMKITNFGKEFLTLTPSFELEVDGRAAGRETNVAASAKPCNNPRVAFNCQKY